jgi:hypothetical protein
MLGKGMARNPFHPERGASDAILDKYNADPNAITVGRDWGKKYENPLLADYGPAGMKFQNAIRAILNNPNDPAFAPYVNNIRPASRCRRAATKLSWHQPSVLICVRAFEIINPT